MCFWYFDIWCLADPGRDCASRPGQFLDIVNSWPISASFICKPTHPEPTSPTTHHGIIFPYLHYPKACTCTYPRTCWNYSNQPILSLFNLPHMLFPVETTVKALVHIFPLLPLPPDGSWSFPEWPLWYGGTWEYNNCLLNDSHLLICCLHRSWIQIKFLFYNRYLSPSKVICYLIMLIFTV